MECPKARKFEDYCWINILINDKKKQLNLDEMIGRNELV